MRTIRLGTVLGVASSLALLGLLAVTVSLGPAGVAAGLAAGWATTVLLVRSRSRSTERALLPADWVTLARGQLAAGVAALVVDSFYRPPAVAAILTLASTALALDAVDGYVARRTGTATALGARYDGEVDAFLILVLSIAVSRVYGSWVLAIGVARYALLVAGCVIPWLAGQLPPRYWRKVVAAVQGVALTVAASGLLPRPVGMIGVGVALVLLAESFGRDVRWLYRTGAGPRSRRVVRGGIAVGTGALVWAVLVSPDRLDRLTPIAFARIPIEGVTLVALGLLLPHRLRRVVAALAGVAFGVLTVVKLLDIAFYEELGRPFSPVLDWGNFGPAIGVVRDSIGAAATDVLIVVIMLALLVLVAAVTGSTVHLSAVAARHRRHAAAGTAGLGAVWALSAALSLQLAAGVPLASTSTASVAFAQLRNAEQAVQDQQRFETAIHGADPYAGRPTSQLLTALRGKDVIVAFVESYGQVAVQGTSFSDGVDAVLRNGTRSLAAAGFGARSAFLGSPTFGGISWLAHSTLQSGLWVDTQQRYNQLMNSDRLTLSAAFKKAGWRTVSDIPSDDVPWQDGTTFYHYDKFYDRTNVGYRGPTFSYASMPDQYTLSAFQRLELPVGHRPVMAEIDLVSSHTPWTPLPRLVPEGELGDGSIFDPMPAEGLSPAVAWRSSRTVQQLYGQSIQYSLQALVNWVVNLHDDNLVMLILGDHQPATTVSGAGANHQVPVSLVAHDPAVLARIASWHWQGGLLPSPTAPLWPMDAFRNQFLHAFGPTTGNAEAQPSR